MEFSRFRLPDLGELSRRSLASVFRNTTRFLHRMGVGGTPAERFTIGGRDMLLKMEHLNHSGSYKDRGAFTAVHNAMCRGAELGVCASTGNFAKAVKLAAHRLGFRVTFIVPESTPDMKKKAIRADGAEVLIRGEDFQDALDEAHVFADEHGCSLQHPYDSPDTVVGQSTLGVELIQQAGGGYGVVVVPIGGGGLASGTLLAHAAGDPRVKVVGVVSDAAPAMMYAFAGDRVLRKVDTRPSIAEGVNVATPGRYCWDVIQRFSKRMTIVSVCDAEVEHAMDVLQRDAGIRAEGAGALATAAVLSGRLDDIPEARRGIASVISGGNIGEKEHEKACLRSRAVRAARGRMEQRVHASA